MANITKTKDGYLIEREGVPTVSLSNQDAFELMEVVERQYHLQDVQNKLEEDSDIDESRVTEEEINKICDKYEDRIGDDDTWNCILDTIISEYRFEYKTYASEDEIKEIAEKAMAIEEFTTDSTGYHQIYSNGKDNVCVDIAKAVDFEDGSKHFSIFDNIHEIVSQYYEYSENLTDESLINTLHAIIHEISNNYGLMRLDDEDEEE